MTFPYTEGHENNKKDSKWKQAETKNTLHSILRVSKTIRASNYINKAF